MPLPTLADSDRLRYFTFFYLYFMQGVPSGFALTALYNFLVAEGLPPQVMGSYASIIGIPWMIQWIWGPLIDRYRYSVVGHYKHWVVLTQLTAVLASALLLLVKEPAGQVWLLAGLFCAHSVVASVQDASVDAMAILVAPGEERGRINGFMRGGILLGGAFGVAVLSYLLHHGGYQVAVLTQTGILLIFTCLFALTRLHRSDPLLPRLTGRRKAEPPVADGPSLRLVFLQLGRAFADQRSLRVFGVIFLSYLCFSVFGRSFNFHLIRTLHWDDQDLSLLTGAWGSALVLSVAMSGGLLADRIGAARLQRWVLLGIGVFLIGFNLFSALWLHRPVATIGLLLWSIADPLYSVAAFPIVMALCRKYIAGSQFTGYIAMINLADISGAYLTGWLLTTVPAPWLGLAAGVVVMGLGVAMWRRSGKAV